jgi:hypothetical protein
MTTVVAPDRGPDHSDTKRPTTRGRDLVDAALREPDLRSFDPTQGRKIGSGRYDDPTQGRTIGSGPYDDPAQGRTIGSGPYDDPAQGVRTGADPYEDATRARQPERSTTTEARLIKELR